MKSVQGVLMNTNFPHYFYFQFTNSALTIKKFALNEFKEFFGNKCKFYEVRMEIIDLI